MTRALWKISRLGIFGNPTLYTRVAAMSGNIAGMRKPYLEERHIFDFQHLNAKEPFGQFQHWFDEAVASEEIHEANAMSLATATKNGLPSVRVVLLKGFSSEGFTFFTNYESRKGRELSENPHCCLMFYWDHFKRSVRIEGIIERIPEAESVQYFQSRPRASQLGAIVSQQSKVIAGREVLDNRYAELQKAYADENKPIPKPDYWGGFLVRPHRFEFWQGQSSRLHDRIVFRHLEKGETINPETTRKGDDDWVYERLSP